VLQLCVPAFAFTGYLFAPESPRWLVLKGRYEEVRRFIVKHQAGSDENASLVAFEVEEIEATLRLEADAKAKTSYLDTFKTTGNKHHLFITITLRIVSYYLPLVLKTAGIISVTQQTLINDFLQVWNLIISVSAAYLVD
jgi:hypothetical protein